MLDPEYVRSLDDEILKDVYYYHNKINDIVDLYTVGCEVSEWDGEKIARSLDLDELKDETIIINTCAVTDLAQKASEKVVERLRRIYPEKKFFIVGGTNCLGFIVVSFFGIVERIYSSNF